jgi:murein DD-endopeptidase MepM/ murein hydrolase activator NlpD
MMRIGYSILFCFSFALFIFSVLGAPRSAFADAASDIQRQIDANNAQIKSLEADIAAYQKELDVLGTKKNTLQSTIGSLALSQKQLATQIKVTQNKIASANLQIQELTYSIDDKEKTIVVNQDAIAKAIRGIDEGEREPLVVMVISADSFSNAWRVADEISQFNRALAEDIANLRAVRTELAANRDETTEVKEKLISLQKELNQQKRSVDANKAAQQQLLAQTKNQEANYQKLIAQKQAAEKAFEQELINLQNQLELVVNPNLLPKVGSGVLSWPFSNAFMSNCTARKNVFGNLFCITQYFGNTAFSTANPQIYNGKGHNAIDIATPIGTPVYAALDGTVFDTGNTDLARGCYSFGKWVMISHSNGLSTLYSHLSSIDVVKGQRVNARQLLGLSGMTGYATGPHLHFGVYATQGTQIMRLGDFRNGVKTGCATAVMPVATLDAYLNPLSYL